MSAKITREILEGYLECRYKGRLRLAGEQSEGSDYLKIISAEEVLAGTQAFTQLLTSSPNGRVCQGATLTATDLGCGTPLLLDATIEHEQVSLRCDGLVRMEGSSRLGDFHYLPVLCKANLPIRQQTRHLLALIGLVLEAVQGTRPAVGIVVRGPECRRTKVKLTAKLNKRASDTLEAVKQMQDGSKLPLLTLNDHCPMCEFRDRCHAEAVEKDDISLLQIMSEAELRKHRSKGIFTVTQLAYTFRPRRKGKRARGESQPHHAALQALAIRDSKTYVMGKPEVPDRPVRVYLDLEGDTNGAGVYLIGALVVKDDTSQMHSFWADETSSEAQILGQLLEVVGTEDFALFHFGSYERQFLRRMRRIARPKGPVDGLLANAVDVLSLIRSNIYFPVHANGLKEIGRHLGFTWSNPKAGGLQSVVWRRRWEQSRDDSFKQQLIAYNAEDCAALRLVAEHIEMIAANFDSQAEGAAEGPGTFEKVAAGKAVDGYRHKWGRPDFVLPEFEKASKCAWFDYQREKIVVRAGRKPSPPSGRREKTKQPRPNRRVVVRSTRCPACKGRHIVKLGGRMRGKLTFDLKVSAVGVRRFVTRYLAARYRCLDCCRTFLPRRYKDLPRFLHTLKCWAMYQHIANRVTFENLEGIFKECFGLTIRAYEVHAFKIQLARRYKGTYRSLLRKIVAGNLLHADETGVHLQKEKGYVWVFTSLEDVVYMYRPSRESDFLVPLLKGFVGVLVSDFFSGYDSMPCLQQKCLVHLIRDINSDLQTHFHDEDLKGLAKAFGALLVKIVATVDRYGLRRERLQGHKADVNRFFEDACGKPYGSEVAEKYRQRFLKYRDKLFTFLDHDGVAWHNNNAEHAVKHFARYRMISNGRMTANGLQPYLVLLSIYQTCKYKKASFLRFLLSGEKDVDAFLEATRRRRAAVRRPNTGGQPNPERMAFARPAQPQLVVEEPTAADLGLDEATAAGLGRKVRLAIEEVARKVAAGEDDPRLRWGRSRRRVRVLVETAFPDRRGRGPALHIALENRLKAAGWVWARGKAVHTYERCGTPEYREDVEP
jgi:predicted RecB family nuclease